MSLNFLRILMFDSRRAARFFPQFISQYNFQYFERVMFDQSFSNCKRLLLLCYHECYEIRYFNHHLVCFLEFPVLFSFTLLRSLWWSKSLFRLQHKGTSWKTEVDLSKNISYRKKIRKTNMQTYRMKTTNIMIAM